MTNYNPFLKSAIIEGKLKNAAKKIAPVWPLGSFVAVNPYQFLIDRPFNEVVNDQCKVAGAEMLMPYAFYAKKEQSGELQESDWQNALKRARKPIAVTLKECLTQLKAEEMDIALTEEKLPTVLETAGKLSGYDWERFVRNRISMWAGAYFNEGQMLWKPTKENSLYATWKNEAQVDRALSIASKELKGFRQEIKQLPENALAAAHIALETLGVPEKGLDSYLQRVLHLLPGWSAYAARIDWEAVLYGGKSNTLVELLAVILSYEYGFYTCYQSQGLTAAWEDAKLQTLNINLKPKTAQHLQTKILLQEALEIGWQRRVSEQFKGAKNRQATAGLKERTKVQAVFCIDVRSEVFRRQFEATAKGIETIGFAGFFGFPIELNPIGYEKGITQCPVLLTPAETIPETTNKPQQAAEKRSLMLHLKNAWYSFKMGAISCFSFVGPVGLAYLPKLFSDAFGLTRPVQLPATANLTAKAKAERKPDVSGLSLTKKVELASGALKAMSLTQGFAPIVMITGHGSTTVNNPHATGLDCGACAGRTGEANARIAADVLNDKEVKKKLAKNGIIIPSDTFFLACQHDTTTDEIQFFNAEQIPSTHDQAFKDLKKLTKEASQRTRAERSIRLGNAKNILNRSKDWAQVRPEWGLAGCANFIVAPRERTQFMNLSSRAFLHSYAWQQDQDFNVLELIMTAPMIVASWISYQYYASTVNNQLYGAGNKTLHNIIGAIGVLEGNSGDLRTGLPMQSIHNGEELQHDPLRLNVIIEAPISEINKVIQKHDMVKNLFDNGWLYLFTLNKSGEMAYRYTGELNWEKM
jgi:uncharacterized protein YbcC (UPF0753/DUF2309 family)